MFQEADITDGCRTPMNQTKTILIIWQLKRFLTRVRANMAGEA